MPLSLCWVATSCYLIVFEVVDDMKVTGVVIYCLVRVSNLIADVECEMCYGILSGWLQLNAIHGCTRRVEARSACPLHCPSGSSPLIINKLLVELTKTKTCMLILPKVA